ncbi:MAG: hypothetical protein LIO76_04145 [Clostridiales bacterium]|nr:hypothetical protein [Clostridiales bacterium]
MKAEQVKEVFQKTSVKVTGIVLAAAIAVGGVWAANYQATSVPELVSYVDTEEVVTVEEEEVPLANTKTTKSTKTTKKTTNVKLSSKSKKTYSSKGKTTTKTTTKTATTQTSTASSVTTTKTTTKTAVQTQVTKKYTRNSKVCKQTTTTKTTVTKTVTTSTAKTAASTTASTTSSSSTGSSVTTAQALATVDSRVATAWNTLGFSFKVNASASYSGYFNATNRTITLKTLDETIYHELGHFVAFVAGNVDTSSAFKAVYNAEKSKYTKYNASYVTQTASEYFAESFKEYTLDPATLKSSRPQTYAAIVSALDKITTSQINKIKTVYYS